MACKWRTNIAARKTANRRPALIAITADVEGLLAHKENCENFDQIIPKPLDIYEICNVIEKCGACATAPTKRPARAGRGRAAGEPADGRTVVAAPMARHRHGARTGLGDWA